jgi:predicted ATP-binding protein involved in virulence
MFLSRYNSAGGQISALENLKSERVEYEHKILQLDEEKIEMKKQLQRVKFEGVESITRKQINELEKNVGEAQIRYEK